MWNTPNLAIKLLIWEVAAHLKKKYFLPDSLIDMGVEEEGKSPPPPTSDIFANLPVFLAHTFDSLYV